MSQFDFAQLRWTVVGEPWQSFSKEWRSRPMEDVVQEETIHIRMDNKPDRHFLVLDAYRTFLRKLLHYQQLDPDGAVVLTGQRGTGQSISPRPWAALTVLLSGKTTWLWFLLVALLSNGDDVIFSSGERFRLFHGERVYITTNPLKIPSSSKAPERPLWCLIDADFQLHTPVSLIAGNGARFPILACPPSGEWYRAWFDQRLPVVWGMPLWNQQDLLAGYACSRNDAFCLIIDSIHDSSLKLSSRYPPLLRDLELALVNPPGPGVLEDHMALRQARELAQTCAFSGDPRTRAASALDELLHRSTQYYGEAPRDVYDAVFSGLRLDHLIEAALRSLSRETLVNAMHLISTNYFKAYADTYEVLAYDVRSTSSSECNDRFVAKFKSEAIGRRAVKQCGHLEPREAKRLFNVYQNNPRSSIAASWVFEGLVHGVLCGQISSNNLRGPLVAMRAEGSGTAPTFIAQQDVDFGAPQHLPVHRRSYTVIELHRDIFPLASKRDLEDKFCVPEATDSPLFDSFFIELKGYPVTAVVWIFRTTTTTEHRDGSERGYPSIQVIKAAAVARAEAYQRELRWPTKRKRASSTQSRVQLNYVLACPEPADGQRVSWDMPEGWRAHKGNVFCQFVNFSVCYYSKCCLTGLTIIRLSRICDCFFSLCPRVCTLGYRRNIHVPRSRCTTGVLQAREFFPYFPRRIRCQNRPEEIAHLFLMKTHQVFR